jgi:stress response protein SCP2
VEVLTHTSSSVLGFDSLYGKSTLLLSQKEVEKHIIERNPVVKNVQMDIEYPSTLLFSLQIYKPIAIFDADAGYFLLSEDGKVLEKMRKTEQALPHVKFYQKISYLQTQPGDTIDFRELEAGLSFYKSTLDLGLRIDTIDINGLNMIALYVSKPDKQVSKVLFTTQKDAQQQIHELEAIIKKLRLEGKEFKSLDLRFKRPIIVF